MKNIIFILILLICKSSFAQKIDNSVFLTVNKKVSLEKYKPIDLVNFENIQVSKKIVPDLKKLLAAAKQDNLDLKVISGYRSYERQKILFEKYIKKEMRKNKKLTREQAEKIANSYSAKPGHSEHQLGTTVDILSSENNYSFDINNNLKYIDWLEKNCEKFNFKISFHKNQSEYVYEPWHLRWYGK